MPARFPPGAPIVWAVGTTNRAKLESVFTVAQRVFPDHVNVIFAFAVSSGVADQPMSATETQRGAVNRAVAALEAGLAVAATSVGLRYADSVNATYGLGGDAVMTAPESYPTIHFGVGLEGGIELVGEKFFECGWMAVAENAGSSCKTCRPSTDLTEVEATHALTETRSTSKIGIGSSARFEMSPTLMRKILQEGKELAEVMDELTGETDLRSSLGAMGVLTAGHLGRAAAYEHGLLFAMAPFLSDEKFWRA